MRIKQQLLHYKKQYAILIPEYINKILITSQNSGRPKRTLPEQSGNVLFGPDIF